MPPTITENIEENHYKVGLFKAIVTELLKQNKVADANRIIQYSIKIAERIEDETDREEAFGIISTVFLEQGRNDEGIIMLDRIKNKLLRK
ncbi:MAG: hypothetical protein ABRQ39_29755, partial [Candidatus Eremiobacterota bacterium]